MKYYDLDENPDAKAGSMKKSYAEEMSFWTKAKLERFIIAVQDKHTTFMTLNYTRMRIR